MTASATVVVSVVMPAFNAERTIGGSIASVLRQTFRDFEILVGDDASTDGTPSIVAAFRDDRIRYFRNAVNQGPGATRDQLLAQVRGQWIAFCDADDVLDPARLAVMLEAANNDMDAIVFDDIMQCHDAHGGMVPWRRLRGFDAFGARGKPVSVDTSAFFNSSRLLLQPLFSRNLLTASGSRHSQHSYGEDTYFLLKLLAAGGKLIYIPEALYLYRITRGSASSIERRNTMLREILESCLDDFIAQPEAYTALRKKLDRIIDAELYVPFVGAIKRGRLTDALRLLRKRPILLWEFAIRAFHDLHYHTHRIYHRGAKRGSK